MMLRAGLLLVALVLLPGCGSAGKPVPVSGRVTLDSKPLANAMVQFVPVTGGGEQEPPPGSVGTTDENGRYSLVLNNSSKTKGAVVGKHKVLITVGAGASTDDQPTFHKQLPQRYNRKSELECEVPARGRDDANFDLQSN